MRLAALRFWIVLLSGFIPALCLASPLTVVSNEFQWFSPGIEEVRGGPPNHVPGADSRHIGHKSYRDHFDMHGEQPPYSFLTPLINAEPRQAAIEGHRIVFPTKSVPLRAPPLPQDAKPARPYLLSTPAGSHVIAVHPYFNFMDKEALHHAAVYSADGDLLMETDALPTHVCLDAPNILVSAERSGCCESLKWTVHFHDLRSRAHLMLGCPEGRCGNFLFARLGSQGPFLVSYETVTRAPGLGYAVQTDIHLVSDALWPVASARIVYAARRSDFPTILPERHYLYSVSNLSTVTRLAASTEWIVSFNNHLQQRSFRLFLREGSSPVPVFLTRRGTQPAGPPLTVSHNGTSLGHLPLMLMAPPGEYSVTLTTAGAAPRDFNFIALPGISNLVTCE